jgi:hypothetical protein
MTSGFLKHCRKDKHGLNMQAICDDELMFEWAEIKWPGASSDYMAWMTSLLRKLLDEQEESKILVEDDMVILGDCAYVKRNYMAIPLKGSRAGHEDAYNFYHSQLRITIERAFGVFVHRWAILRSPLVIPLVKTTPLVASLIRLHNFCIREKETIIPKIMPHCEKNLRKNVEVAKRHYKGVYDVVELDEFSRPTTLLNHGNHFADAQSERRNRRAVDLGETTMDRMIASVKDQGLRRPKY